MEALGAAELRLYRRPSYGAPLVLLAALESVAPPHPLEVGDPEVEEVDDELGRRSGMYVALVQGGRVVDVGRLVTYAGEAPGVDDEGDDYWAIGSDTSNDMWHSSSSSSDQRESSDAGKNNSRRSNEKEDIRDHEVKEDEVAVDTSSSAETRLIAETEREDEDDDDGEDEEDANGEDVDGDDEDERDYALDSKGDEDHDSAVEYTSSSAETSSNTEMDYEDEDDEDEEDKADAEADDADGYDEEQIGYALDSMVKISPSDEQHEMQTSRLSIWQDSTVSSEEDEDKEDDADGEGDDDQEDRSLEMKLRLWPAKKHLSIKIFRAKKWVSTKVYRITWADPKELEELFEFSFKMDISAPVSTNTVFRVRACTIDFEIQMADSPNFDDLISELKPSVKDFRFCKKIGGENPCRVFRCLSQGSVFALKTIRLEESCITEPREVEIISSLKDKRIMAFYQAWVEPWTYKNQSTSDYLFIQLELCQSTLKDKLLHGDFESIMDRWYLIEEILKGVKTAHDELIVHRDLKPDNVFFGFDMVVRIGDFGDACIGHDEFGGYGGTPGLGTEYYSAPELESSEKITEKADIHSVGVMLLEMFSKFDTDFERYDVFEKLRDEGELPDKWVPVSEIAGDREGVRELVERMTSTEAAYRPSAAEILESIQKRVCDDLEDVGDEVS